MPWPHLLALPFAEPTYFGFPAKVGQGSKVTAGPGQKILKRKRRPFATSAEEIVVWSPTCKCKKVPPKLCRAHELLSSGTSTATGAVAWPNGCGYTGSALRRLRTLAGPRPRAPAAPVTLSRRKGKSECKALQKHQCKGGPVNFSAHRD